MSNFDPVDFEKKVDALTKAYESDIAKIYADQSLSSEEKKKLGAKRTDELREDVAKLKEKFLKSPSKFHLTGDALVYMPARSAFGADILKAKFPWPKSAPDASEFEIQPDPRFTTMPEDYFKDQIFLKGKLVATHLHSVYGEHELHNTSGDQVYMHKPERIRVFNITKSLKEDPTFTKDAYKILIFLISDELKDFREKRCPPNLTDAFRINE